jgi:hypothetical protein
MITDAPDEVDVPHLKERLWDGLAELHAQRGSNDAVPPIDLVHMRRRSRRSLTAGVAALVAATLGIIAVTGGRLDGGRDDDGGSPASSTAATERIVAATEQALGDSVIHVQMGGPESMPWMERWIDETTGSFRTVTRAADGAPVVEMGPGPGGVSARLVDHCRRQYADDPEVTSDPIAGESDPRAVLDALAAGELAEDGTEVVAGRELIRLAGTTGERTDDELAMSREVLVDPSTHRPVLERAWATDRPGDRGDHETTYEYLPRSSDTLDLVTPRIPDGYTRVDHATALADLVAGCP